MTIRAGRFSAGRSSSCKATRPRTDGSGAASGASTTRQGSPAIKSILDGGALDEPDVLLEGDEVEEEYNAWGGKIHNIDQFMLGIMHELVKDTKLELPKDKKKGKKKGKDTRKR